MRGYLFCFVAIVLFLPLAEQSLPFITSGPLKGGFKPATNPVFNFADWFEGTFQRQKELYLNDVTGFRADLVRLNNQIYYSLFDKCHAGWTVKGKNAYLFQRPYIEAYYGQDFVGYQAILEKSIKLKALQDTLGKLGKSLILVYAPSKSSSYPEYFPDNLVEKKIGSTNNAIYRHIADSLGINQVDMDSWFVSLKNKSKEPIFSKQGVHWTKYGAILAGDSLMKYIEKLRNIKIQHPDWSQMEHTDKLRDGDDDVGAELNLIFPVARETLAYPVIRDIPDSGQKKINAIYIGDSYTFKMVGFGIINKMNNQCEYWGYYDEVHEVNNGKFTYIKQYDCIAAINKADCIIVEYTTFNFANLGNGFIEQTFDHYYPKKRYPLIGFKQRNCLYCKKMSKG